MMTAADPETLHAEIRRLRAALRDAEDERDSLRERLTHAEEQIRRLRARVTGQVNQAAAPREK
jgi:predicted  nucleic acid-binding Zn-ribbon protein